MFSRNFWLSREVLVGFAVAVLITVPILVLGGNKQVYVDHTTSGTEDGSKDHPYHSIIAALKHVNGGTDIHIAKGTYKGSFTLPKNVKLLGQKQDIGDVVIESDSDTKPAITMKDHTELNFLTIDGGRHGVRVIDDAKAKIYKVLIKNSDRDGVHIDAAPRDAKHRVLIDSVEIKKSAKAGIYSEKRDLVVIDSDIHDNDSDGIDLAAGMKAWLEGNRLNNNNGSGLKVVIDNASVWTKSNSIRHNKREGVEVDAYGAAGNVGLKKAQIIDNGRYGVARVARTAQGYRVFSGIIFGTDVNDNRIEQNSLGMISGLIRGF